MKKALAVSLLSAAALLAGCSHRTVVVVAPPPPMLQVHALGVQQGYEAARSDVAAGRPPSFGAHPRYLNPPVPGEQWNDYRAGFRQGYEQFLHHGPPPGM